MEKYFIEMSDVGKSVTRTGIDVTDLLGTISVIDVGRPLILKDGEWTFPHSVDAVTMFRRLGAATMHDFITKLDTLQNLEEVISAKSDTLFSNLVVLEAVTTGNYFGVMGSVQNPEEAFLLCDDEADFLGTPLGWSRKIPVGLAIKRYYEKMYN